MADTYKAVVLTGKGGPEVLQVAERRIEPPGPGQLRVRVLACGVGYTDVVMRRGYYPYAPKIPFVPGYEVIGTVDALGPGVSGFSVGQKVAALTVHGGYAELLTREADEFVPVPEGLDDAEAVSLILNYVTAYQMLHRTAKVQPGQTALVTGASGGVGTALLQLCKVAGVKAIGAASRAKHATVEREGATPVDYKERPLDEAVRAVVPGGVDVAFDAIGGRNLGRCARALRKGGLLVCYGFSVAAQGGSNLEVLAGMVRLFVGTRLSGQRGVFYGITAIYRKDRKPFREDLPVLFRLLAEKKIKPLISERLPLLEARRANELLEQGTVSGKLVLVA